MIKNIIKKIVVDVLIHTAIESGKSLKDKKPEEKLDIGKKVLKEANSILKYAVNIPFNLIHQVGYLAQDTLDKVIDVATLQIEDKEKEQVDILLIDETKEVNEK